MASSNTPNGAELATQVLKNMWREFAREADSDDIEKTMRELGITPESESSDSGDEDNISYQLSAHSTSPPKPYQIEQSQRLAATYLVSQPVKPGFKPAFIVQVDGSTKLPPARFLIDRQTGKPFKREDVPYLTLVPHFNQDTTVGGPYYESAKNAVYILSLGWIGKPKPIYMPDVEVKIPAGDQRAVTINFVGGGDGVSKADCVQSVGIDEWDTMRNVLAISSQSVRLDRDEEVVLLVTFRYQLDNSQWELTIREKEPVESVETVESAEPEAEAKAEAKAEAEAEAETVN